MDLIYVQLFLFLLAASRTVGTTAYYTTLDAHFIFECDTNKQTIYAIESKHSNSAEDRQFQFRCRDVLPDMDGSQPTCSWSGYVNEYDYPVNYMCPGNQYVNGLESTHDNGREDRNWNFLCCSLPDIHIADCSLTLYTNDFDKLQRFHAGTGEVMKGMDSYHDNGPEDRRYRFYVCTPFRACS